MPDVEAVAVRSANRGAAVASDLFETDVQTETKSHSMDYVTTADLRAQSAIVDVISDQFPDDTIRCEERSDQVSAPNSEDYWVVDPIDGTSNFVVGNPIWATSVGVVRAGRPVAAATVAPALSETYIAAPEGVYRNDEQITPSANETVQEFTVATILRYGSEQDETFSALLKHALLEFGDLRRFGCAQLTLAMVAHGALDACLAVQPEPNPWDTISGVHLVEQAGGTVTDVFGDEWTPNSYGLVASNGRAHEKIIERLERSALEPQ